jgi:DNA-binding NarL/FixJ family response regulator
MHLERRAQWAGQLRKASIVLADDHPNFPRVVEGLLKPDFRVISCVFDGKSLVETSMKLRPDVIITDISMPVLNGIEAAIQLRKSGSKAKVIFLTVHSDADFVRACLAAGASGYVLKARLVNDLLPAVRDVLAGGIFVPPEFPC